jgi:ABC-type transport system substrate-binding protein
VAVASQLGQVCIKARLVPTERAKLQQDWIGGTFEGITSTAWATTVDPAPMMVWSFHKRKGHAPDDKLNGLVDRSQATVDPQQRLQVLREFGRYVHGQAYWMFMHSVNEFYARRRDVPWQISAYGQSFAVMRYYRLPVA